MFINKDEQEEYIKETFIEVTDNRINDNHWDLLCSECDTTRGFQVVEGSTGYVGSTYEGYSISAHSPISVTFRCPVCKGYKQWVMYKMFVSDGQKYVDRFYRIASLPSEGVEDIEEIPSHPPQLRVAYKQAIRAMDANAHIAAAAMFRRALQIITRDILNVKHGTLALELKNSIGVVYNGVTVTNDFATIGYIVKEAGNQGAHPDSDTDLLDFTAQDAQDLQKIFMEIITDLFVIPEATKKAREEFLKRRKITP